MNIFRREPRLKQPKNYLQEVLFELITCKEVKSVSFPYISDVPKYISTLSLDYGLNINREPKTKLNRYGNSYTYKVYSLANKDEALKVYESLTK